MPLLVPLVAGAAVLGLLALTVGGKSATPPARTPSDTPQQDKPVTPPPAPRPNTWPAGTSTAVVIAPSGLNVRSAPNETGTQILATIPRYERVQIINSTSPPLTATPAAPQGWWQVRTLGGASGYMSAQWLFFGTDAEAHMSDADFQKYEQEHQDDEEPTFQGVGHRYGHTFGAIARGGHPSAAAPMAAAPAMRRGGFGPHPSQIAHMQRGGGFRPPQHQAGFRQGFRPGGLTWYAPEAYAPAYAAPGATLRCVAPSGCYLRVAQGGQLVPSGVVVENGAPLQVLRTAPGPKTDPSSPSLGGWTLVSYSDRAAGRSYQGWLPSEWLVNA